MDTADYNETMPLTACWPLSKEGPLPKGLLGPEYLEKVFFRSGPIEWQCSASAVRKWLKALRRGAIEESNRSLHFQSAGAERDRDLAVYVCDNPRTRERIRDFPIEIEEGYSRFGRQRLRSRKVHHSSLSNLLWLGFRHDPSYNAIVEWTELIGISRPDIGDGDYYLTAEVIESALSNGSPHDFLIDTVEFARALILFAGLLPHDEAFELLLTASRLGCSPLEQLLFMGTDPMPKPNQADPVWTNDNSREQTQSVSLVLPPRLESTNQGAIDIATVVRASAEIDRMANNLIEAEKGWHEARRLAEGTFEGGIDAVLGASDAGYEAALRLLDSARRSSVAVLHARRSVIEKARELTREAYATIGFQSPQPRADHDDGDAAALAGELRVAEELLQFARHFDASVPELANWRVGIVNAPMRSDFERLAELRQLADEKKRARNKFSEAFTRFICNSESSAEVAHWLRELGPEELACVVGALNQRLWLVPSAILMRRGLDAGAETFAPYVRSALTSAADQFSRRALLRFCDPASSALDSQPLARRIIAVERLRDILQFGPLALIADPSSGLGDVELVGKTLAEFAELMVNHLELLSEGMNVRSLLATRPGQRLAVTNLVELISTPSTMTGNYRRLRERARETLFAPLVQGEQIDFEAASDLARRLRLEDMQDQIVEDIRAEIGPGDRIEARHKIQLDRYLAHGREILESILTETHSNYSERETLLRRELVRLLGQMRSGGEVGSLTWLEGEVASILMSRAAAPEQPTLVGDAEQITARTWTPDDSLWARSILDLPEFYIRDELKTFEVAAAALRWRGRARVPEIRDVVDELLSRRCFGSAVSAINEAEASQETKEELSQLVETEARPAIETIRVRLTELRQRYRRALFERSSILPDIERALSELDPDEAGEQCDLLELELSEAAGEPDSGAHDAAIEERKKFLLHLLLLAGTVGVDDRSPVGDLEVRWSDELLRRENERLHLTTGESAFRAVEKSLPILSDEVGRFRRRNLEAGRWLPSPLAADLAEILRDPVAKLDAWIISSSMLDEKLRDALINLSVWFIRFIGEQAETLHSLESDASVDPVFDRAIEVSHCVFQSDDPAACLRALAEIGEVIPISARSARTVTGGVIATTGRELERPKGAPEPGFGMNLTTALERDDWQAVGTICRQLRASATDEEIRRIDEIADFARAIDAIRRGDPGEASDVFVTAARLLGSIGQPVHRTYPLKRLFEFAFDLLAGAMSLDHAIEASRMPQRGSDSSWAPLFGRRGDFLRSLEPGSRSMLTARIIEQLCTGALGGETVERLWDAATKMSEPGAIRAALLAFLHDQYLFEHIIRLASRYEPGIRPKLEQLLELRNVAAERPDLIPVAQSVAIQVANAARAGPFRTFVRALPLAAQRVEPVLDVRVEQGLLLRFENSKLIDLEVPISIEPRGLVPEKLEIALFSEDDVTFDDGTRRNLLSDEPVYIPSDYILKIRFGDSWVKSGTRPESETLRLRVSARTVTGGLINQDTVCSLGRLDRSSPGIPEIDIETLLDFYPGVGNTPAEGEAFIGRNDEMERLREVLVSARTPSPVLLTGMRRIGKTSLLFAFHRRYRQPGRADTITVYLSLAEGRAAFMDPNREVGSVLFNAISHALSKPNFSAADHNREVGQRLQSRLGPDRRAVRKAIDGCRDPESLADSLILLGERLLEWVGGTSQRLVLLIDEAETLVLPYHAGGQKRIELEQLLQSLREVSQTSQSVGIVLAGSDHIKEFAQQYKNAFFGSSVRIELAGIGDVSLARQIVAPNRLLQFIQFEEEAIQYAIRLCAGVPQFMWQVGAATSFLVRAGPATRADVRRAVTLLVRDASGELPFQPYNILQPLEYMLDLQGGREPDLLWLLLWRIADVSSLVAEQAPQHFILDQTLLELDDGEHWKKRLLLLVELGILEMPKPSSYQFKVPIFAEGFRAPRNQQERNVRYQRLLS